MCNDELLGNIGHREITTENLDKIIKEQLESIGKDKLITSEDQTKHIPKVVFRVLKECNFSVRGEQIATKIHALLKEVTQ